MLRALNAFEARVKDFHSAPTATYASMILQAGERYEGDVALNNDPRQSQQHGADRGLRDRAAAGA